MELEINQVVWIDSIEGYAVIVGITPKLKLVVEWYDDDGYQFRMVIEQKDIKTQL